MPQLPDAGDTQGRSTGSIQVPAGTPFTPSTLRAAPTRQPEQQVSQGTDGAAPSSLPVHPPPASPMVFGLHGEVVVAGGCKGGFCKKTPRAAPCWRQPVLANFKTDSLLPKAEPITDTGVPSVIIYVR